MKEYKNLRIWKETQKKLKLLAAYKEISVIEMLDKWVTEELNKFKK